VTTAVVDWHHDDLGQRFSVILGADIVYEQRNWQALDQFFKRHLLSSGKVVMTEPGRDTGQSVQDFFRAQGWNLETSELAIQANGRPLRLLIATLPSPH